MRRWTVRSVLTVAITATAAVGCAEGATGAVQLFLEAEDTITNGLVPGPAEENVVDGWTVSYGQFVVAVGDLRLARSAAPGELRDDAVTVIDLAALPSSGTELSNFGPVAAVRWDQLGFATVAATTDAARDESVPEADFEEMIAGACAFLVRGTITNETGESCPHGGTCETETTIDFSFCVPAVTVYTNCTSPDHVPGVAVPSGGTVTGAITFHGDHIWFNAFPSGGEGTIERRVQWLADSDLDHDGTVTRTELEAIDAAALFTTARHYSLAGAPVIIDSAWDFVVAQMSTQGHFQGEGDCVYTPTR